MNGFNNLTNFLIRIIKSKQATQKIRRIKKMKIFLKKIIDTQLNEKQETDYHRL